MFTKDELQFLFACVESQRSQDTAMARVKATVMTKLAEGIDNITTEAEVRAMEKAGEKAAADFRAKKAKK